VLIESQEEIYKKIFDEKISMQKEQIERMITEKVEAESKVAFSEQIQLLKIQIDKLKNKFE
jgi:hypothetical protein